MTRTGLSAAAAIALLSIAAGEAALRLYNAAHPSFIFYDESYYRFRGRPHAKLFDETLNSYGFRGPEIRPRDKRLYRIVGLGDSFAFGVVPYARNYLHLLEKDLSISGRKAEVVDMGISSTAPKDYLAVFALEGLPLEPDMALVSVFLGNDLVESDPVAAPRPLYSYSYVASLIRALFVLPKTGVGAFAPYAGRYEDDGPTFTRQEFLRIERDRVGIFRNDAPRLSIQLAAVAGYLKSIGALCRARGIALVVVLIPDQLQVDAALRREVLAAESLSERDIDLGRPGRELSGRLSEAGIATLDLTPDFAEEGRKSVLYKPRDTHWNIAGNRLAARVILKRLQARGVR